MPNWAQVLEELATTQNVRGASAIDVVRRKYLKNLSELTGRNAIAYYSAFLSKPDVSGTEINDDDKNGVIVCVHQIDRKKGLDLILHTPGGGISATQSLVHYLKEMFGSDIRAIVPQIAMSAGTMIACSCKEILLGKHSNLGPVDPQIAGFPALAVKQQFDRAFNEIMSDARAADVWNPILRQLGPSFLQECDWAIEWTKEFVQKSLAENMLSDDPNSQIKSNEITKMLLEENNRGHSRHFHYQDCIGFGLKIKMIEEDQALQNAILTVHHCYMHTLSNTPAIKIVENQEGRAIIKMMQGMPLSPLIFGLGAAPPS